MGSTLGEAEWGGKKVRVDGRNMNSKYFGHHRFISYLPNSTFPIATHVFEFDQSAPRTLVYAIKCPILMRTEMGPKMVSPSILMRTESPNFGRRFDPFCVCKWPVGTEVRSHFRTFVAVALKSKFFTPPTSFPALSLSTTHRSQR